MLEVTMTASWDHVWKSNGDYNNYNGNLALALAGDMWMKDDVETGYWEWATISASRNGSDKPKGSGKSLTWGDLVQGTDEDVSNINWAGVGAAAFEAANDFAPTAWSMKEGSMTEARKDDKKKKVRYINGMGATFMRAIDAGDASMIVPVRQGDTVLCTSAWLNNDSEQYGWGFKGCVGIFNGMPALPMEEGEKMEGEEDGAANLAASFLAVAALFALNY